MPRRMSSGSATYELNECTRALVVIWKPSSVDAAVENSSKELSTILDTNTEQRKENAASKDCTTTTSGQTHPAPVADATSQETERLEILASQPEPALISTKSASQHPLGSETEETQGLLGDLNIPSMDLEVASSKRRRDSDDGAQEDETEVKSQVQWKVVSGGKKRNAARQRSSSLKRDDGRAN
ncbi:hypothetical protein MTO96_048167 [Rhipicephalus appendiculatus]